MGKRGYNCDIAVNGEMAHHILRLCTAAGVPLNAMGICANISGWRAKAILAGEEPTKEELQKLADALNVSPEDILPDSGK